MRHGDALFPMHMTALEKPVYQTRPQPFGLNRLEFFLVTLTVFLAPINYLRLEQLYFTAGDFMAVVTLCVMVANGTLNLRFFGVSTTIWLASTALFISGLAFASIAKGNPIDLTIVVLQYCFTLILLPLIIGSRKSADIEHLLKTLILSIAFIMVFGAYVVHFVDNPDLRFVSGNGRLRSLIERENECAMLGAIGIVLTLGLFGRGSLGLAWLLLIAPLLYGVLLTGSNTGLFLTLAGSAIVVVMCKSMRLNLAVVGTSLALLLLFVLFGDDLLPEVFRRRVLGALLQNDLALAGTFVDRLFLFEEAIRISGENILVGLGANQYREVSAHGAHVHSAYLLALTEAGVFGLLGLVGLLVSSLYASGNALFSNTNGRTAAISLTITLMFIFALNMFPTFYARFFLIPLILTTAFAAAAPTQKPAMTKSNRGRCR